MGLGDSPSLTVINTMVGSQDLLSWHILPTLLCDYIDYIDP